jgi:hypothetical protein
MRWHTRRGGPQPHHAHQRADEKVSTELKKQIVQARTAKKLTQAQLGQVRRGRRRRSMRGMARNRRMLGRWTPQQRSGSAAAPHAHPVSCVLSAAGRVGDP